MSTPLHELADTVTAPLKDDPELRLDVRREVLAHLEDTAAALEAEGAEEPEAQAAKAFGAPEEIAGALLEANARRMKRRALARLCLRVVLVPAAVVVALWVLFDLGVFTGTSTFSTSTLRASFDGRAAYPETPWMSSEERARRQEFLFLLQGDTSRPTREEQLRAIWEAKRDTPEAPAYFADYARALQVPKTAELLPAYEAEMRLGEQVEPDNALYPYLLAYAYLDHAGREAAGSSLPDGKHYDFVVRDRAMLDRAVAEVRRGLAKPYLSAHLRDVMRGRLALLPPVRRFRDTARRGFVTFDDGMVVSARLRALARIVPFYAGLRLNEGGREDALALARGWHQYCRQTMAGADSVVDLMVAVVITNTAGQEAASVLDRLGEADAADRTRAIQKRALALWEEQQARQPDINGVKRYGGMMARLAASSVYDEGQFTAEALAPERHAEHALLEGLLAALTVIALLALMLYSALRAWRWRLALRGQEASPLLLLPTGQETARILLYGVLLPMVCYALYTRLPGLSGREYGMADPIAAVRFLGEVGAMLVLLIVLPGVIAARVMRRRGLALGLPVPARGFRWAQIGAGLAASVWVFGFVFTLYACWRRVEIRDWVGCLLEAGLVLAMLALPLLKRREEHHALFYGTVARSLVPVYAAAAILLGVLAYPALVRAEEAWLSRDRLIISTNDLTALPTPLEYHFVEDMKAKMLATLAEEQ